MIHKREPRRAPLSPIPAVLGSILSVVGGAAIAKGLFPTLGAAGTAGIRAGLSALMLLAVFRPRAGRLRAEQWRAVVPYGIVLGAMNLAFYLAISRIPLGLGVTLEFTGPLGVAVFGSRRRLDFVWVVLAGAGIALIAPWTGNGIDPAGVLLALLAGGCWAAYIILGGRVSQLLPEGVAVSVGMVFATATILPFTLAGGGLAHLTPRLFAAGAAVALLSSAVPYTLEMIALRALPPRTFGILMSLEPAVAAGFGLVLLGELLAPAQWLAVALVVTASVGATVTSRQASAPTEA
jgi:inner membrane transporter RhtA